MLTPHYAFFFFDAADIDIFSLCRRYAIRCRYDARRVIDYCWRYGYDAIAIRYGALPLLVNYFV